MKKALSMIVFLLVVIIASAQDVIVKKDGTTILSKVTKVGETEVEYKKFNNQQGPTYVISTNNIMAINYESGAKDTFETSDNNQTTTVATNTTASAVFMPMSREIIEKNEQAIADINSRTVKYIGTKKNKKANARIFVLGMSPNSILEDNNIKVSFEIEKVSGIYGGSSKVKEYKHIGLCENEEGGNRSFNIIAKLTNKTNKTIYIDLANCFSILNGEAESYYIPSATQVTRGNSTGVSVNAGAITGALGIGGTIGTLANGVNVGSGSSSATTNITYSQRVISVPPMSTKELESKPIGREILAYKMSKDIVKDIFLQAISPEYIKLDKKNNRLWLDINEGEEIVIPDEKIVYSLGMAYTYAFSENISDPQSLRTDFGIKRIIGAAYPSSILSAKNLGLKWEDLDIRENPLFYF